MTRDSGGLLGLACCQFSSRLSEKSYLKGIWFKKMEQDTPCPPLAFMNVHKCAHLQIPTYAYKPPMKKDIFYYRLSCTTTLQIMTQRHIISYECLTLSYACLTSS